MGFGLHKHRVFQANTTACPRAAIYVTPDLQAMLLNQFPDRDMVVVRLSRTIAEGGDLLIAYCYMPDTAAEPFTDLLIETIEFSKEKKLPLLLGCDANAHHVVWGSTDINPRGTALLQFIAMNGLNILNKGNTPTFVTKNRSEVLDITLASEELVDQIRLWKISLTPSFSDHRCIVFNLKGVVPKTTRFRNPRKTNWEQYRGFPMQHVEVKLATTLPNSPSELNEAVRAITSLLTEAYELSCPEIKSNRKRNGKIWSAETGKPTGTSTEYPRKLSEKLFGGKPRKHGETSVQKWSTSQTTLESTRF